MIRLVFTLFLAALTLALHGQSQFFQRPLDPGRLSPGVDVVPTGPDQYLFASLFFPGGPILNGGQFNLTRLRPSGEIIWSNDFTYPFPLVSGALDNWNAFQTYLFAGLYFDTDTLPGAVLKRMTQDGTVVWSNTYSLGNSINPANIGKVDVRGLASGDILLGAGPLSFSSSDEANDLSLMKISSFGEVVWGKNYCFSCLNDADLTFGNVALTADSGYVVCGGIQYLEPPAALNQDVFLMKVDTAGQLLWARSYNIPDTLSLLFREYGFAASVLPNGHIAIVGEYDFIDSSGAILKDGLILEVDDMGLPVRAMRVNLGGFSKHHIYLNHLVALDSTTLVIPGSSIQDTIPAFGAEYNFLFRISLEDGSVAWAHNYFTEVVEGFGTFPNGFAPLPAGFAYLANYAEGFDTYYPYLIVADIDGRTACHEPIELAVQTGLMIEATDFAAEVNDLNDKELVEPTVAPFDEYLIDVPVLDIGPSDFFCEPTTVPLDATVQGAESYQWNTGATTAQILADVPGIYFVEDTSHMECWILRDTAVFNILPPPVVTIGADTTGFCETGIATLTAIAVGAESLFWSTGATTSTITVSEAGAYTVQAQNICGTAIQSFTLVLPDCDGPQGECRLEIPNVFTPDGDGTNDRFRPLSNCEVYDEYRLRIYSRWGELVFTSSSPAEAWDGRYNDEPMASDLYAWILEYRFPEQEETKLEKGEVTLIR